VTVLAGDIGGTKTALALFDKSARGLVLLREDTLPSREFDSLELAIEKFLGAAPRVALEAVCLGVAGPVVDGRCVATNLPWVIDERALTTAIPARRVKLLNDLEVAAHGVLGLPDAELYTLQAGTPHRGHMVLIAAGTGLGEALIVQDGDRRLVIASEGGHADFAPRDDLEMDLLRFLRQEFGRVSLERILSGPGLFNVYRFLRQSGWGRESSEVAERMRAGDPSAVVTEMALAGRDAMCSQALDVFVSVYGAEAGNLALKAMALGGVFVGGGIAPRILPRLTGRAFVTAFRDKGRLATLMEAMPIRVALDPRAPLRGAAGVAFTLVA
jgi:glucokinase